MKNPFCLGAVYKTVVDGGELEADIRVPYPKEGKPFGVKCPVFIDIPSEAGLGVSYSIINKKHNEDLVHERRYIVVSPEYRALDPATAGSASSLRAPIQDCRDLLAWIYDGGLQRALDAEHPGNYPVDYDHVYASGISYGGLLALSLGWNVPRPVAGILDVAGPCHLSDDQWKASQEATSRLPSQQKHSDPSSLCLEAAPNSSIFDAATSPAANDDQLRDVDPALNVRASSSSSFPPVFIVHGTGDEMVPIGLSRRLLAQLREQGVRCELAEVEGAGHLFASALRDSPEALTQVRRGVDFLTAAA
ncbi:Alpha/Beta hydrolase protein [Apiospora rasikravindrae]|uniref:Alpha/Beta hydrolase protein n=1 Tax=Apiospora rasikravindrae TaxID=990691 RepID=A0ABR1UAA7_9PEZI